MEETSTPQKKKNLWNKIKNISIVIMVIALLFLTEQIKITKNSFTAFHYQDTTVIVLTWHFMYSLKEEAARINNKMREQQEYISNTLD